MTPDSTLQIIEVPVIVFNRKHHAALMSASVSKWPTKVTDDQGNTYWDHTRPDGRKLWFTVTDTMPREIMMDMPVETVTYHLTVPDKTKFWDVDNADSFTEIKPNE